VDLQIIGPGFGQPGHCIQHLRDGVQDGLAFIQLEMNPE
jgi:hypothetical protein